MNHGKLTREIAQGLKVLRQRITDANIPTSELDQTLNIATWNIREFGAAKRVDPSFNYIAEIVGQFDLISIAELQADLDHLYRVIEILGPYWKVVYSDYINDDQGGGERFAFLYDNRSVVFNGLAAEADETRKMKNGEPLPQIAWWRRPYIASFRAGHFDFVMVVAHIRWGESEKGRGGEIEMLAQWVDAKIKEKGWNDKDIIVTGDFNIPSRKSELYKKVTQFGLETPKGLLKDEFGSDLEKKKTYDQILHYPKFSSGFTDKGGVLDFYRGDHASLYPGMKLTKQQFTFQLSDHLPLWIQLQVDTLDEQIDQVLKKKP